MVNPKGSNLSLRIRHGTSSSSMKKIPIKTIISHGLFGLCFFYAGLLVNMASPQSSACAELTQCPKCLPRDTRDSSAQKQSNSNNDSSPFPATMNKFIHSFGTVPRNDMDALLEIGVPMDPIKKGSGNEEALILYPTEKALPGHHTLLQMNASTATQNCMSVKMILQDVKPKKRQCLVIMPQWESNHVHKFMRLTHRERDREDSKNPLRYVSLSHSEKGTFNGVPDMKAHIQPFHKTLTEYLHHLDQVTSDLKPQLQKLNSKTIIVLVCNFGQSELLHNFVCNARAKGIDLSSIFLFATDQKTYDLAQSLGIPAMHDEKIFADMPEKSAGSYGDRTFAKMMMAKVYCVHLVLYSGFNVLFQDVDVVWNQNPLPILEAPEYKEWDLMFQDDGARSVRYFFFALNWFCRMYFCN
jgi:hypothetical protein